MTAIVPTPGRIVIYCLSAANAEAINRRRADARRMIDWHREHKTGAMVHVGNDVKEGDTFPMIVSRVWGDTPDCYVNGSVMLDGTDTLWATSVKVGEGPGTYSWMPYQLGQAARTQAAETRAGEARRMSHDEVAVDASDALREHYREYD